MNDLVLFFRFLTRVLLMTGLGPGVAIAIVAEKTYVFRWAKQLGMSVLNGERKGQLCRVLARGRRNSCLVEFPDGLQAVTSRNAIRKVRA